MYRQKLIGLLVFGYTLFCNCYTEPSDSGFRKDRKEFAVNAYARLPTGFKESSGLTGGAGGTFWTLQDGGNEPYLYQITADGRFIDTLKLNLPNADWESLTRDREGNFYIGDFGNNLSRRKNLRIFRYNSETDKADTIHFSYPEQEAFPPVSRKERNFDCEAFFWHGGALHLFSKSYGDREVTHYVLPDSAGQHVSIPVEKIKLRGLVTGAALRPDGKEMALLTYGRIYLFKTAADEKFFSDPYICINLAGRAQTEAIVYVGDDLLLTNEQGRLIYVFKR